ncbi:hypothetical protein [Paludisphaera sp.]|uniref:hypothetical protein n=1 Tax=Paludisphaera sp. TaxID=2017432 RepID=UPI00301C5269
MNGRCGAVLAAMGICLGIAGCNESGDGRNRVAVSGKVTVEGEPLAKGSVTFRPEGDGAEATGVVENGAFTISAADGPTPGKYKVSAIEATERAEGDKLNNFSIQPQEKPSRTTIGGPLDAEVKAEGENVFPLDFPRVDTSKGTKGRSR